MIRRTIAQYSPRSFCTGVPDRTGISDVQHRELTDSSNGPELVKHLGSLVIFRFETLTFIANDQVDGWNA
jgi:hypothetical protein